MTTSPTGAGPVLSAEPWTSEDSEHIALYLAHNPNTSQRARLDRLWTNFQALRADAARLAEERDAAWADNAAAKLLLPITPADTLPNNSLAERARFVVSRLEAENARVAEENATWAERFKLVSEWQSLDQESLGRKLARIVELEADRDRLLALVEQRDEKSVRFGTELVALRGEVALLRALEPDYIAQHPSGDYIFLNEAPDDVRKHFHQYRALSEEQRAELREYAEHLAAKQRVRAPSPEET